MPKGKKEEEKKEAPKKSVIELTASYKAVDETDGTKIRVEYAGKGATVGEALADIKGADGEAFPEGVNCNILVGVKKGGNKMEKSVAPFKALKLLVDKDETIYESLFRGF